MLQEPSEARRLLAVGAGEGRLYHDDLWDEGRWSGVHHHQLGPLRGRRVVGCTKIVFCYASSLVFGVGRF